MMTVVRKWGNSIAVRLPRAVAHEAAVAEGSPVNVEAKDGQIVITPVRKEKVTVHLSGKFVSS